MLVIYKYVENIIKNIIKTIQSISKKKSIAIILFNFSGLNACCEIPENCWGSKHISA